MELYEYFSPEDEGEILAIMEESAAAGVPLYALRLKELLCNGAGTSAIISRSPSGGACLCFRGRMVFLVTPEGIRPVMEDPFLCEGESAIRNVLWSEKEKRVFFDMHQIVRRLQRSAVCDYSGESCHLGMTDIRQEER